MANDTIVSAIATIQHAFAVARLIAGMPKMRAIAASGATASTRAINAISHAHARDLTVILPSG